MENKPLVNRVAQSGLITLNLEDYFPKHEMVTFDLKDHLFKGLILREKEFRLAIKEHDWSQYSGKVLLVVCTADAIIPLWAYMLVAARAANYAIDIFQGTEEEYIKKYMLQELQKIKAVDYQDKRIVIKGCGDRPVPAAAYLEMTRLLQPSTRSIMYGEPCSTVPVYKRPKISK